MSRANLIALCFLIFRSKGEVRPSASYAGTYSHANGYWGSELILQNDGGYQLKEWSDNKDPLDRTDERGKSYGTFAVQGGTIVLGPKDSQRKLRLLTAPLRLLPISWGQRRYLLREEEFSVFRAAILRGEEPRFTRSGNHFLLREGDYKKLAPGLPKIPKAAQGVLDDIEVARGSIRPGHKYLERVEDAMDRSFKRGNLSVAAQLARELLKRSIDQKHWNYGNVVHDANQVIGMDALQAGRIEEAKRHLLLAGKTPGSPQLDSLGPQMMLAQKLLKRGEKRVVIEYLELVGRFWKAPTKKLDEWKRSIISGGTPRLNGQK